MCSSSPTSQPGKKKKEFTLIIGYNAMDVLTKLTDKISLLLERQDALKLENMQLREELELERQNKESVLARVENLLNTLQEVDRN